MFGGQTVLRRCVYLALLSSVTACGGRAARDSDAGIVARNAPDAGAQRCVFKGLAPAVRYPTAGQPMSLVAVGPVRGGQVNLLVGEQSNDGLLGERMLGTGDGSFALTPFVSDLVVQGAVAADFDGDDQLDLVNLGLTPGGDVNTPGSGLLQVVLGASTGTFAAHAVAYPAPRTQGLLTTGDFDGDGHPDVAVAGNDSVFVPSDLPGDEPLNSALEVFRNAGDGTFEPAVTYPSSAFSSNVVAGDFNGDGKLDLAEQLQTNMGAFDLFLNAGDGAFPNELISTPNDLLLVGPQIADFDGDGKDDLASTAFLRGGAPYEVEVFSGSANGNLRGPVKTPITQSAVYAMATGDFNGDEKPDLALVLGLSPVNEPTAPFRIALLLNQGNGTFAAPMTYDIDGVSFSPTSIVVGDFNHDGISDMAIAIAGPEAQSSVNVWLARCE